MTPAQQDLGIEFESMRVPRHDIKRDRRDGRRPWSGRLHSLLRRLRRYG